MKTPAAHIGNRGLFSILTFDTLEAIKREAMEVRTWENASEDALAVSDTLVASIDAECERRINWAETVQEALAATGTLTGAF
jgi:hypothetical protein